MGRCWITVSGTKVPKVSKLVESFLNAIGTQVSPHIIRQCWPLPCDNTPVQNLEGKREIIVHRLDEVAMRCLSNIAWDKYVFPQTDQEFWREEVLCYHLGKMLDVRAHMPGLYLMLQDDEGQYANSAYALKFEGLMLIYDPQCDIAQWVPVQGVSASLTMMELCTANDLNNMVSSPYDGFEPVRPPYPEVIKGIPAGAESDMDSVGVEDSGDEWDRKELGIWSHCPSPPTKVGGGACHCTGTGSVEQTKHNLGRHCQ